MKLTIVHGGQTGVDRGAHEAAIEIGWRVTGFMPRDGRDEHGLIPADVAKFLVPHDSTHYAARTEANVRSSGAALIIVSDVNDAVATPGTAKTIELTDQYRIRRRIIDPRTDAVRIARWLFDEKAQLTLGFDSTPVRDMCLLVAGPRESKWHLARVEAVGILRRVSKALAEIGHLHVKQDLSAAQR